MSDTPSALTFTFPSGFGDQDGAKVSELDLQSRMCICDLRSILRDMYASRAGKNLEDQRKDLQSRGRRILSHR